MGCQFPNKIFFRADAGHTIGYGHFVRTLALADMLKKDFACTFFTCHPTGHQISEMIQVCPYVSLNEANHYETFLTYIQGDEIVVLDNYFFTTDYQRQIKAKGCKLVCIDDMHDKHYVADLVINHAPGIKPSDYSREAYTRLCLGTDYLLLRKNFFEAANRPRTFTSNSIFICFGGSDENNLTQRACRVICQLTNRPIIVIVGDGYQYMSELKQFMKDKPIDVHSKIDAHEMVSMLLPATLAIVPASTMLLEACCVRIPIITGYDVDNQQCMAANCGSLGLAYNCGNLCVNFEEKLKTAYEWMNSSIGENYIGRQKELMTDSTDRLIQQFKLLLR